MILTFYSNAYMDHVRGYCFFPIVHGRVLALVFIDIALEIDSPYTYIKALQVSLKFKRMYFLANE